MPILRVGRGAESAWSDHLAPGSQSSQAGRAYRPPSTGRSGNAPIVDLTASPRPISDEGLPAPSRLALALIGASALLPSGPPAAAASILQYHRDLARDGVYVDAALTRATAATLHRDPTFTATTQGATYAQPLYLDDASSGRDLILVATEENRVYALDATTGAPVWSRQLAAPVPLSALPCGNIDPLGITGTPVIDPASRTVFLDAMTAPHARHLVFALSVDDGATRPGYPVDVAAALSTPRSRTNAVPSHSWPGRSTCPTAGTSATAATTTAGSSASLSPTPARCAPGGRRRAAAACGRPAVSRPTGRRSSSRRATRSARRGGAAASRSSASARASSSAPGALITSRRRTGARSTRTTSISAARHRSCSISRARTLPRSWLRSARTGKPTSPTGGGPGAGPCRRRGHPPQRAHH